MHKKPHTLSIKWKLFMLFIFLTSVMLLLLWLCQVVFLEDIYRHIKTTELESSAEHIMTSIHDDESFASAAKNASSGSDICIMALRMMGFNRFETVFSYDNAKGCAIHNLADPSIYTLYDDAKMNNGKKLQHYRYDSGRFVAISAGDSRNTPESIIYTIVAHDNEGHEIVILLNSVISPMSATVKTLNSLLIYISIIMFVLSLVLAFLISNHITKPIIGISKAAKKLGEGNYNINFIGGSYKEADELANTLNYAKQELSKVENLRRELIANVSHDLRTPLTMISGYAEVMRDLPGENTPENAQTIVDEANRLTSLVNDMLDISKFESGNIPLKNESFDLTEIISSALDNYSQFRAREGYKINFYYDRHISVFTDKSKLLQAFYNILNNAITYTGDDKVVVVRQEIEINTENPFVRISVTDTGEGIPKDKLELIWDRYYKIDKSHKRAAIGTGLGLSIVRKIMDSLGGRCGVRSELGKGSTFCIELPIK